MRIFLSWLPRDIPVILGLQRRALPCASAMASHVPSGLKARAVMAASREGGASRMPSPSNGNIPTLPLFQPIASWLFVESKAKDVTVCPASALTLRSELSERFQSQASFSFPIARKLPPRLNAKAVGKQLRRDSRGPDS